MNIIKSLFAFLVMLVATLFTASHAQALALGNHAGGFFLGTLDCTEVNKPSTRNLCRENGWLNYDTLSGCSVATNKIAKTPNEAGEGMVKLFHHTDNAGGAAINKSGVLEGSKTPGLWRPWRTGDVYLTTKPELNTFERLFYGLSKSKTNAVVPVTVPKSSVGKGPLGIRIHPGDIEL